MLNSPAWAWAIPLIVSTIALLGVGITIFTQGRNFNRQLRSAHSLKIAEMRQAWINNLRDTMAVFQSYSGMSGIDQQEKRKWHEAGTKIELLMNPADPDFKELHKCIYAFLDVLDKREKETASDEFIAVCQSILKREWDVLEAEVQKSGGR